MRGRGAKGLALLVGAPGSGGRDDDDDEDVGTGDDGYADGSGPSDEEAVAAEDILAAVRARDAEGLAAALRDFVDACMASRDGD